MVPSVFSKLYTKYMEHIPAMSVALIAKPTTMIGIVHSRPSLPVATIPPYLKYYKGKNAALLCINFFLCLSVIFFRNNCSNVLHCVVYSLPLPAMLTKVRIEEYLGTTFQLNFYLL